MMNRLISLLFIFVLVPFIATAAVVETSGELTTQPSDDASDSLYEYFDPQNEEEAYKKLATTFPLKYFSPDQEDVEEDEHEYDSSSKELENIENEEVSATTTAVLSPTEVPETVVPLANANETEIDSSHGQVDTNSTNLKSLISIPSETDDEPVYHSMAVNENNAIHKSAAVTYPPNESYVDDDYVNDGVDNDANDSPVTNQFNEDTTTVPLASPSSLLITRTPQIDYTNSIQQTTNSPPSTSTQNATASKKSAKKFETTSRIYKYSADEILRKYLEDTYIRAPLAALINTSPEALRKAKILWKSTLRPNTPIDIVLLAFNSSGKFLNHEFLLFINIFTLFSVETIAFLLVFLSKSQTVVRFGTRIKYFQCEIDVFVYLKEKKTIKER